MNILCVKWGTKYSSEYVNKLYNMVLKNCNGQPFDFYCYTDNPSDLKSNIKTVNINSDLKLLIQIYVLYLYYKYV